MKRGVGLGPERDPLSHDGQYQRSCIRRARLDFPRKRLTFSQTEQEPGGGQPCRVLRETNANAADPPEDHGNSYDHGRLESLWSR
jgi:hypothetical protein